MKQIIGSLLLGLLIIPILCPIVSGDDLGIIIEQYNINLSNSDNGLIVEENIQFKNNGIENATLVKLWIQQGNKDVRILTVESGINLIPIITDRIRECNLSKYNLTLGPGDTLELVLTYILQTNTENFEKTIPYDTTSLTIIFNDEQLYQVQKVQSGSSFSLLLYKPTEAPLSITYIVIIFILVVILITSTLLLLRKQRKRVKTVLVDSKEILTTKKSLLLSLLKELEKQYRAKTISDDTYNKLKNEYKQQAVFVMKKLEDLK